MANVEEWRAAGEGGAQGPGQVARAAHEGDVRRQRRRRSRRRTWSRTAARSHGQRSLTAIVCWKVVLVVEADRSIVMVCDCLAGDCDPTFLIFARNRGGARKGKTTRDPTFLLGVRRLPIGGAVSQGREGRPQKMSHQKIVLLLFFLVVPARSCVLTFVDGTD